MANISTSTAAAATYRTNRRVIMYLSVDAMGVQILKPNANLHEPYVAVDKTGKVLSITKSAKILTGIRPSERISVQGEQIVNPSLQILQVPANKWGKPDIKLRRMAGLKIQEAILNYLTQQLQQVTIEIISTHDMYVDLSTAISHISATWNHTGKFPKFLLRLKKNMFLETVRERIGLVGIVDRWTEFRNRHERWLIIGGQIAHEIIYVVKEQTGFSVSCGIGESKLLARLGVEFNRPASITILPQNGLERLGEFIMLENIPGVENNICELLKGKFGQFITMHDVRLIPFLTVADVIGYEFAIKVKDFAFGADSRPVEELRMPKSIYCESWFSFQLPTFEAVETEIINLAEELVERIMSEELIFHKRVGKKCVVEVFSEWTFGERLYSQPFNIGPKECRDKSGQLLGELAIGVLARHGFEFNRFFIKRIVLAVVEFEELVPPKRAK